MRRMALAVGILGAVVLGLAAPAWAAPNAGQFCKNAEAGLTTTANNGRRVTCTLESGRYHWAYSDNTTATTTGGTVAANPTVAAASTTRTALASTGLNHTRQVLELAVMLLGLGVALVLEVHARNGLDRLRQQ